MTTTQTELPEYHAHEVMEMMISSGATYSRESLGQAIREKFGMEATFFSCSSDGMTPEDLIDFLEAKGKLTGTAEAFRFDTGRMCSGH